MKELSQKTRRRLYRAAVAVLLAVFVTSCAVLVHYAWQSGKSKDLYSDLQELAAAQRPSRPTPLRPSEPDATVVEQTEPATEPSSPWLHVEHPVTGETVQVLPEYAQLFAINPDLVGWIQIDSIGISYPVMQTPDRPDHYLRRDFYGNYSNGGCIYAEEAADVNAPSDNITLYGHRMSDGSMFADLIKFTNKSFWEKDPYIYFDTLTERHTYQIVFVFTTTASVGEGFKYHQFVNARDEWDFYAFVDRCREEAFFDTGIEVVYGDKLITLSTCEYSHVNGRLVVVAKRVS